MQSQQKKYDQLRSEYPYLSFDGYDIQYSDSLLQVKYSFDLSGKIVFKPGFSIKLNDLCKIKLSGIALENLVFQIGMAELISYWKTTCSPRIIIYPHLLEPNALVWWKNLFFKGLGEFFYTNCITPSFDEFLSFECSGQPKPQKFTADLNDDCLIPVGGGKDSAVTLEILSGSGYKITPFFLNPTQAAIEVARLAGFDKNKAIIINRTLDPELFRMNDQGFLNGHTPFSALLAFYSLIASALTGSKNIVLSNESSANEPTIAGSEINHQYSKSFAFEKDFRDYCRKYVSEDFNYFSFLRPLNELQIAALFARFDKYHSSFRSCNAGSKSGIWCGKCSKCLFTFVILSPFLEPKDLQNIFVKNLFDDPALAFYLDQLCGLETEKPFDCVGTVDEVNAAMNNAVSKYHEPNLPLLLQRYKQSRNFSSYQSENFKMLLQQFNDQHFVADPMIHLLKTRMNESIS